MVLHLTLDKISWISTYLLKAPAAKHSWPFVLSAQMRSFTTEKLEAKRLGHFSKAVTKLNFPLEHFKSETAEFKPVRIQAVQAFTHTCKHGHKWRKKWPPFLFILYLMKELHQERMSTQVYFLGKMEHRSFGTYSPLN